MFTNKFFLKLIPKFFKRKIEDQKTLQKILNNINWLTIEKVLIDFIKIFVFAWVARYLGPKDFGIINYAIALVVLFSSFAKLGLDNIVIRNLVSYQPKADEILGSSFFLKIIGSIVMLIVSVFAICFIKHGNKQIQLFVFIISFGYTFKAFEIFDIWFQSQIKSKYSVYSRFLAFFVISVCKILFILIKAPLIYFVYVFAVENIITSILLFIFYLKVSNVSIFKWKIKTNTILNLLKDSWPLILSGISVTIYHKIDQIMIGDMLGDSKLGFYSAAVKISEIWYFIPMIVTNSVFPSILNAKKKDWGLYLNRFQILYNSFTWFTIAVSIIISIFSPVIINLIYGKEYFEASIVLSLHIWASIFVFLGVASSKYLIAENLTTISFIRTFLGAISNIVLNIFLIPLMGINGAALATLLSYFISNYFILITKKGRVAGLAMIKSFNIFYVIKEIKNNGKTF